MSNSKTTEEDILKAIADGTLPLGSPRDIQSIYVILAGLTTRFDGLKELLKEWREVDRKQVQAIQEQVDSHEKRLDGLEEQNTKVSVIWAAVSLVGALVGELLVLWIAGVLDF